MREDLVTNTKLNNDNNQLFSSLKRNENSNNNSFYLNNNIFRSYKIIDYYLNLFFEEKHIEDCRKLELIASVKVNEGINYCD
jgi:hypothetical protein